MTTVLVLYDIRENRVRDKVSEACKDYGLARFQYSAFTGELSRARRSELKKRLQKTLGDHSGRINIFVVCEKDLKMAEEIMVGMWEVT